MAVTSYGRNKNRDDEKKQEKANCPSYRCEAIKQDTSRPEKETTAQNSKSIVTEIKINKKIAKQF